MCLSLKHNLILLLWARFNGRIKRSHPLWSEADGFWWLQPQLQLWNSLKWNIHFISCEGCEISEIYCLPIYNLPSLGHRVGNAHCLSSSRQDPQQTRSHWSSSCLLDWSSSRSPNADFVGYHAEIHFDASSSPSEHEQITSPASIQIVNVNIDILVNYSVYSLDKWNTL